VPERSLPDYEPLVREFTPSNNRMSHTVLPRCRLLVAVAVVLLFAGPAAAQDPDDRHISVGAAAGIATPFSGVFEFTAISWQADVRVDTARHFGFSVFIEEWRHTHEEVFGSYSVSGPSGIIGHVDRLTTRGEYVTRTIGWSLLGKDTMGRATIRVGGGVSYFLHTHDSTQTMTGCEPASLCSQGSYQFNSSGFAAQLQAGVDVLVAAHTSVMGQFRLVVSVRDPAFSHASYVGGARFVF
jgi:hypothetical protein